MSELSEFRLAKDAFFRDDEQSPLTPEQQAAFQGLPYYPEDAAYDVLASVEPLEAPEPVTLVTSRGTAQHFYRIGRLHFKLDDTPQQLTLFQHADGEYLLLPFTDATSGVETYGAGRYVEVEDGGSEGGRQMVRIDFNRAYNPYCAYNEDWVCPIPPAENRLSVPIRVGEKMFHAEE